MVCWSVLGYRAFETNLETMLRSRGHIRCHVILVEFDSKLMLLGICSKRVVLLTDGATGFKVTQLDSLLVKLKILVIRVSECNRLDSITQVVWNGWFASEFVFQLLSWHDTLTINIVLVTTLRGLRYDCLCYWWNVTTHVWFVRSLCLARGRL